MIENTHDRDPALHLLGVMSEGTSGYITGMEAAGQAQVVASEFLPTEGNWEDLTALGIVRGEEKAGDPIFTAATLPAGWRKVPTDHAMWSNVEDERGVPRIAVFYKAAFYDRRAWFHVLDVGDVLASKIAYAETDPERLPDAWPLLTPEERQGVRDRLTEYAQEAEDTIARYGDADGYYRAKADRALAGLRLIAQEEGL